MGGGEGERPPWPTQRIPPDSGGGYRICLRRFAPIWALIVRFPAPRTPSLRRFCAQFFVSVFLASGLAWGLSFFRYGSGGGRRIAWPPRRSPPPPACGPPIQERTIVTSPATELDEARAHLIAVHLAKLAPYASRPGAARSPLSSEPFPQFPEVADELTPARGRGLAREWMAEATPDRIRWARSPGKKEGKGEETTTAPEG